MREPAAGTGGPSGEAELYPDAVARVPLIARPAAPPAPFADVTIRRLTFLGGPNVWTYRPVLEALIDLGALEDRPSNTLPGFFERLAAWLPTLVEHRCSEERRGGFFERLRAGTWTGHIMEHVALELQTLAGQKMGFGRTRETHERGVYKLVIRTDHPVVGEAALTSARDLVMAAINDCAFDVGAAVAGLARLVDQHCLGPSTACIVAAAARRHIPAIRLSGGNLVQLGHGAAQRRIWTAETDQTSAIADEISRDKDLTKRLLANAGVPVPEGEVVASADAAWQAAQEIGLPVAVKPTDGNHARGVSLNLTTREQVSAAFAAAEKEGSSVMVERQVAGSEHRLLVVGGQVVAATRGETVCVTGDGKSTIAHLIETQVNTDPRRGAAEEYPLEPLLADDPVLALVLQSQGLAIDSVLPAGASATVQRTGNMDIDVTAEVHPEVAAEAALAARVVGLDIAGIDLVTTDIGQPLAAQRGALVEVNAGPGLLMHLRPARGAAQPVGEAIASHLFPGDDRGRIPLVGILGDASRSFAARLLADLLQSNGWHTGLACRRGLFSGRRRLDAHDATGFKAAQSVLINRAAQAAVIETSARRILAEGLPYDRCQVGVVLAMPSVRGLEEFSVTQPAQMPGIARTQIDVVLPHGTAVLNADAADVLELARYSDGAVMLFGTQARSAAIDAHRARFGRAVLARGTQIVLAEGLQDTPLVELTAGALFRTTQGQRQDLRPCVLAATAAAWALGLAPELIRAGLLHLDETA